MKKRSDELLAVATREIGYHEKTGKRNKYGAHYKCDGMAWCMFFVQWCYEQAGMKLPCFSGSCGAVLRWYKANQPECVMDEPVPGCIVIFDFPGGAATDHTGLFVSRTGTELTTVDGNTSGTNQSNGGWVQQKTRRLSYARPTYIVPRELIEEVELSNAGNENEENQMVKRYNTIDEIRAEVPWAVEVVEKMIEKDIIKGRETGLDLSEDMLRMLEYNNRYGLYR